MSKAYRERQRRKKSIIRKILKILIPLITTFFLAGFGYQAFVDNNVVMFGRTGNQLNFPGISSKVMFYAILLFGLAINLIIYNDDDKYDGLLKGLETLVVSLVIFAVMLAICYLPKR